jgi:hypothetical protein
LINTILTSDDWNPLKNFASDSQHLIPPKCTLPDDIPFGIGCNLIVDIPVDLRGTVDIYIDNFIGLTVDLKGSDNTTCLKCAPLLGLTVILQKVLPFEPLPQDDMDARAKLVAETGLSEQKVILGWFLNLRRMTIALPENKFIAYSNAIHEMFDRGWTTHGELELNIG